MKPTGKTLNRGRFTGLGGAGAAAVLLVSLVSAAAHADVFYYKDADGVFHFTNVPGPRTEPFIGDEPLARDSFDIAPTRPTARTLPVNPASYDDIIYEYADHFEVEPALVKAVIHAESSFNRLAVSRKGARGLMQLMPKTARAHGVRNVYDPRENIRGGVKHLRKLLDQYGNNLKHVLAAYNAGEDPVARYRGVPPYRETRTYVNRVLRFRQKYLRERRVGAEAQSS